MNSVLEYLDIDSVRFPNKTAITYKNEAYTFVQLKELSMRIGAMLHKYVKGNQPVCVMVERGIEALAYFLGVLCSGNYYVPVDPTMPVGKLQAILEDASFSVILADQKYSELIQSLQFSGVHLSIDCVTDQMYSSDNTTLSDPAYMVYTSGSTGKPKGVLKSHGAVISFIEAYCKTFVFSEDEIIGNQTPFYFDASAKDIFLMLKSGCTLDILPSSLFMLPPELIDYLNERKITFASWVPTVLSLVSQLNPFSLVKPTTLKRIFFVGEVMPMKHLNTWRKNLPDIQYVNLYGQSEIAGVCCYYEVSGEFADTDVLPMGITLPNCSIYLLDGERVIHEPFVLGEMYLVSDALAMEYYHDPEKTAMSFLYKDFGNGPVRCFRTGDLAQYDNNGNLVFGSRKDFQIKHMGHRIELGEIEAVAGALPAIHLCCCHYHQQKRKIVLFCQLREGYSLNGQQIRSMLRSKLSEYMLPQSVIVLPELPLNANGKINRTALKEMM